MFKRSTLKQILVLVIGCGSVATGFYFWAASGHSRPEQVPRFRLVLGQEGALQSLDLSQLRTWAPEKELSAVVNPTYPGPRNRFTYRGFDLAELVSRILRPEQLQDYQIVITCLDGYRPVIPATALTQGRGFLAFQESPAEPREGRSQDGLWTLIQENGTLINPGPLFLVWDQPVNFPQYWPDRIAEIKLVRRDQFNELGKIAPADSASSVVKAGFQVFSKSCFVCHSLHGVGPVGKGPDLALLTPGGTHLKPPFESLLRQTLKDGRGSMPSFATKLSESEIGSLISYFDVLRDKHK